jgi:hypothetical protein
VPSNHRDIPGLQYTSNISWLDNLTSCTLMFLTRLLIYTCQLQRSVFDVEL